jgi:CHAT domain-containing protein
MVVCDAYDIILRRKGIGVDVSRVQKGAVLGGKYPRLKAMLNLVNSYRRRIGELILSGPQTEDLKAYKKLLNDLNDKKENLEEKLARRIPEMRLETRLRAANRDTINNSLSANEILIEFVYFYMLDFASTPSKDAVKQPHYLAFILIAGDPDKVRMVDLGDAEKIDHMITKFLTSITEENKVVDDNNSTQLNPRKTRRSTMKKGSALRKILFDPLKVHIGHRKRIILAPDADLTRLPFEVLPINENGLKCLVDEYCISYVSTGRDILRLNSTSYQVQSNKPIVAADPDFNLGNHKKHREAEVIVEVVKRRNRQSHDLLQTVHYFKRLRGTQAEGKRIARMLNVKPILGKDVLERQLKAYDSPSIFHIATHGFFLLNQTTNPSKGLSVLKRGVHYGITPEKADRLSGQRLEDPMLRSGLALAGANTWLQYQSLSKDAEDGILTAEDVSGMNLHNTDLVVLSACETALGDIQIGEGVFGLRRSFVIAGARTLIMSLWKVPDKQTQKLMVNFYRNMLAGLSKSNALREAQLQMKKKYPNPFYWGAFICQGDPRALFYRNVATSSEKNLS